MTEKGQEVADMFRAGFRPAERLSPADWCERHVAEIPYSPIPGAFRAANAPMMRDVMAAIANPRVRVVSIVASIQSSKTLAPELTLAYIIANMPGPALWLDVTDDAAKLQSETRLQPLFENVEPVKALFPLDKNKKRNRTIFFRNGMTLWILGANNRRNLQSRSIRWLFGDETWQWAPGRMVEAEARVAAFGRLGKCVFMSQGSRSGDDTDRKFKSTNQNEWCFTCPHCGAEQPFAWENIHWDAGAKSADGAWDTLRASRTAYLLCARCGARFEDSDGVRARLNATAKFIPQNPNAAPDAVGYHWNSLAMMSWGTLAEMFLRAKAQARSGNVADLAAFYQQRLGVAWREDDEADFDTGFFVETQEKYALGEDDWAEEGVADAAARRFVPAREWTGEADAPRLRFMTVDVQQGYFFFVVRAWSPTGDSRLIMCGMAQIFADLTELRDKWRVPPRFLFIDGSFETQRVAAFAAENDAVVLMGDRVAGRAFFQHADKRSRVYSPRRLIKTGASKKPAESYYFSNLSCKDKLAELRRNEREKWELPRDVPADYLRQLGSEYRTEGASGKPIWLRRGQRPNHYWDCETMQVCAAFMTRLFENAAADKSRAI